MNPVETEHTEGNPGDPAPLRSMGGPPRILSPESSGIQPVPRNQPRNQPRKKGTSFTGCPAISLPMGGG
jgi:hypothetical protein